MKHLLTYCVIILLVPAAPSTAGVVVDHPPLNTGGLGADTDFFSDSGQQVWQQVADDILLDAPATVRRVVWWGFYGGNSSGTPLPPEGPETMRIRFYDARPADGLPGDRLFEETVLNPSRTATGRNVFTPLFSPEFIFQADLTTPFELAAGVPLWLEIVQIGDVDSHFRWEFSSGIKSPLAFVNPFVADWTLTSFNANSAFQLSTIPEPGSLAFFAVCLGVLATRRGRKGVRGG